MDSLFAEVILPFPLAGTFTYRVPEPMHTHLVRGMRVIVPFGKRKLYTGIVYFIHKLPPQSGITVKDIHEALDEYPIINIRQFQLWDWIADYYQTTLGEVMKAALPSGLKLESETKVYLHDDYDRDTPLNTTQQKIADYLQEGKPHTITEISKRIGQQHIMPALDTMVQWGIISLSESIADDYRPKTERYVTLHESIEQAEQLQPIFDQLKNAPKQTELLMRYLSLSGYMQTDKAKPVKKAVLLEQAQASDAALKQLTDKNILAIVKQDVTRLTSEAITQQPPRPLTPTQQNALTQIKQHWDTHETVLLHGVTSSGKTELYIQLIDECLAQGKQALYLVPEIALTTQLTDRLQAVFGQRLGVYHSRFSDAERVEIYQNVLQKKGYQVILGVRSSIFLPFDHLGLIIIDEEHDASYKQQDPAPRYHARNTALVLAQLHQAKSLLGTATPAIETYHNAQTGKYGLVELQTRYKDIQLPAITVVDMQEARRKKLITGHFSDLLIAKMQTALQRKEQIILFQNRRGYAPYMECKECSTVPHCANCDISLTLHRKMNRLVCHYCGYTTPIPRSCPACGSEHLFDHGLGTERVEAEVRQLFPNARIARMDLDTTRKKYAHKTLIQDFANHKTDILIGTQMVSKGLNFNDVNLVAILNADQLLNQPDFRAYERAFQLLEQVSGRAGRMHKQGEVIIQTSHATSNIIQQVASHNYAALYHEQNAERKRFHYPPYSRLIQLTLKHREEDTVDAAGKYLAQTLQQLFGTRCSDSVTPITARIQNLYLRQLLLRIETNASIVKAKQLIQNIIEQLRQQTTYKNVTITIDVDPM